jgi:hypothetical protein
MTGSTDEHRPVIAGARAESPSTKPTKLTKSTKANKKRGEKSFYFTW